MSLVSDEPRLRWSLVFSSGGAFGLNLVDGLDGIDRAFGASHPVLQLHHRALEVLGRGRQAGRR